MEWFGKDAELGSIFIQTWIDLGHGALRNVHPFHTPVLASMGRDGPDARVVVLRDAILESRQLLCHTDLRSPKVEGLRANPKVTWLFYDQDNNTQLRIRGEVAVVHGDELAQARWQTSASRSRSCYHAALPPGTQTDSPLVPEPLESGFENFAVIDCQVTSIDWLFLQHAGHVRARFDWNGDDWNGSWLAP